MRTVGISITIPSGDFQLTTPRDRYLIPQGGQVVIPLALDVSTPLFYPDVYIEIDDARLARGISASRAFNKAYDHTGSFFESPLRRKLVDSDRYFTHLVAYTRTRRNPQKHGFVDDCHAWPYSSYRAVLSTKPTRVQRATVLDWFGGWPGFEEAHALEVEGRVIEALIGEDRV